MESNKRSSRASPHLTPTDVFIITSAMATWLVIGSYKGWLISTTHSGVGAAIGLALFKEGIGGVNWQSLGNVAGAWILPLFRNDWQLPNVQALPHSLGEAMTWLMLPLS
ncbi:MAG TPA: hypothetical protein ENJ59_00305 [Thermofilum sp.]|nr:hypothetical protein [Thermofilum sp.]